MRLRRVRLAWEVAKGVGTVLAVFIVIVLMVGLSIRVLLWAMGFGW